MGTIKSKIGKKFEQKRKEKWVKEKANLVKAYLLQPLPGDFRLNHVTSGSLPVTSSLVTSFPVMRLPPTARQPCRSSNVA